MGSSYGSQQKGRNDQEAAEAQGQGATHDSISKVGNYLYQQVLRIFQCVLDADHQDSMPAPGDQWDTVDALDQAVRQRRRPSASVLDSLGPEEPMRLKTTKEYDAQRAELQARERALAFDHACTVKATAVERRANDIIQILRQRDDIEVFAKAPPAVGYKGQKLPRFAGDHFLYNADLIEQTAIYGVAQSMPKGSHLHIHFNANLLPKVLLDLAEQQERMCISSDFPLISEDNYDICEIQFCILSVDEEKKQSGNLFDKDYPCPGNDQPEQEKPTARRWMQYKEFRRQLQERRPDLNLRDWLLQKLVFNEEEAHGCLQTQRGAWAKFNGRTRMMKGLFNYEKAYKEYTKACLWEFANDNIQYAEIRPNFMPGNQVLSDDGLRLRDNEGIMNLIIEGYEIFKQELEEQAKARQLENSKKPRPYFGGLKVIYCVPRSFTREQIAYCLDECLAFKLKWPNWIAGFDLVGEEGAGHPIKYFRTELLEFQRKCYESNVDIPFLFHCGETLEMGTDTDGNLLDALLLNTKRIGHGFSLARHPYIMEQMKKRGICLESCPISNEILGLTSRVEGHAIYNLLANNVHCTLNTDNGTLFKSRLSHDFYQIFVGKKDMTLHGWRQLAEWSIEHACLTDQDRADIYANWEARWIAFCEDIVSKHADEAARYEKEVLEPLEQKRLAKLQKKEEETMASLDQMKVQKKAARAYL